MRSRSGSRAAWPRIPDSSRRSGTRRSPRVASACARRSSSSPRPGARALAGGRRRGRARAHGDARPRRPHRPCPLPTRQGRCLVHLRAGGRPGDRRLPVRARVRGAERDRRRRRGRDPRRRDSRPRARRGAAAHQTRDPGDDRRRVPRALRAEDREAVRGGLPLGGGSGEYGVALGIAFQIADDVLDCSGATIETGKIAGTDLRDGTPTLPLLLAAQQDAVVRERAGGRPAATGHSSASPPPAPSRGPPSGPRLR